MTFEWPFLPYFSQAHLVAAFEKSLGNMTGRLQSLTMTAEQKVCLKQQTLKCGKQSLVYTEACIETRSLSERTAVRINRQVHLSFMTLPIKPS